MNTTQTAAAIGAAAVIAAAGAGAAIVGGGTDAIKAEQTHEEILRRVYEGSGLFDNEYDANRDITFGEAAMAFKRMQTGKLAEPEYDDYSINDFEHEYSRAMRDCKKRKLIPEDKYSAEGADSLIDSETASKLFFAGYMCCGTLTNADVSDFTREQPVTRKTLAESILKFDVKQGINPKFIVKYNRFSEDSGDIRGAWPREGASMRFSDLPKNAGDYRVILKDVPNYIYEEIPDKTVPATKITAKKDSAEYRAINTAEMLHFDLYEKLHKKCRDAYAYSGLGVELEYYPSLLWTDAGAMNLTFKIHAKAYNEEFRNGKVETLGEASDNEGDITRLIERADSGTEEITPNSVDVIHYTDYGKYNGKKVRFEYDYIKEYVDAKRAIPEADDNGWFEITLNFFEEIGLSDPQTDSEKVEGVIVEDLNDLKGSE